MDNVSLSSFKCPWCEIVGKTLRGLSVHVRQHDGKTTQDLYDALYHPSGRPTCKCGCGQVTIFLDVGRGYGEWLRGHKMRVQNNWGHNEKAQTKSQATRREMWNAGELKIWNEGLSKETDERVASYARQVSDSFTSEKCVEYSERLRKNRLDGTVPTLRGADHYQWKGGLSSINNLAHSLLYKVWIRPKMAAGGFKCSRCPADHDLCVHHDKERFSDLLREAASQIGYDGLVHDDDFTMKSAVAQRLADIHVERSISGVVLCRECHARAHEALGETNESAVIRSGAVR